MRFVRHSREEILGPCEEIVPASLGFQFSKHPCAERLLLRFGQLRSLGDRFLEQFAHGVKVYSVLPCDLANEPLESTFPRRPPRARRSTEPCRPSGADT